MNTKEWLVGLAVTLLLPIALKQASGFIAGLIAKKFVETMDLALQKGDAEDDKMVLALNHWIDAKLDGILDHPEKIRALAEELCLKFPILKGRESNILEAVENLLKTVDEKAKEISLRPAEPPKP